MTEKQRLLRPKPLIRLIMTHFPHHFLVDIILTLQVLLKPIIIKNNQMTTNCKKKKSVKMMCFCVTITYVTVVYLH